jgi:hypothetical protein
MTDMSRAIRHVIEDHATLIGDKPALQRVKTGDLEEITTILGAFYMDTKAELERRREAGNGND